MLISSVNWIFILPVLDDVVVAAHGISSITHRQDAVVQLSAAALGLVIHTMSVINKQV